MQKGMQSFLLSSFYERDPVKNQYRLYLLKKSTVNGSMQSVIFSHIHVRQIYNTYGSYGGVNDQPLTIASPDQVRSKLAVLLYFAAKPNNDRQFLHSPTGFLWHWGQLRWGAVS